MESILKCKATNAGKTKYFIKWVGFPHDENTWETEEALISDGLKGKSRNSTPPEKNAGSSEGSRVQTWAPIALRKERQPCAATA